MTGRTLAHIVAEHANIRPDLPVLTVEGGGARPDEVRNYLDLWDNGQRLARGLRDLGMDAGDRFALLMANHAEFVEAMVAAAISGTVFVPIDPRTRGDRLAFMLRTTGCRGVIAADYALDGLASALPDAPGLRWAVVLDTGEAPPAGDVPSLPAGITVRRYPEVLIGSPTELAIAGGDPDRPMQFIFTSGTTGDPKAIVMTHRRFCDTAALAPLIFGYAPDERPYSGLSLTHANAQLVTLGASLAGGLPCVLSRRFSKSRLWDITHRYGCTTFALLGGMTTAIYAEPPQPGDADNPVRVVISSGMPAALWDDFEKRFGVRLLEFYGAAEGGLTIKPVGEGPVGSIGRPVPVLEHRIVDEQGRDCPPGVPGELLFRNADHTPFAVQYWDRPDDSAAKCRDGWLHMGDVVRQDEDGWLYFEYRKGGGIRHNGEFIAPAVVEKVVAECPDVDDVHVYGVPAASGAPGEKDVVAAAVPRDRAAFDPQSVFRACRAGLEPGAVPTYVQVLDQIPKTASEKPQERFLLEAFEHDPDSVHTEQRGA
ncbi:AMP-binding protein [Spirillospora sp. NPDC048823]|uniref:AMP-binding protein n=1 Tax=unclassified Spirillospora TaxID=2642701 RepID=UPI0037198507